MPVRVPASLAALMLCAAAAPAAAIDPGPYAALRAVDQRLATIADRLTTANAALCRDRQPAIGATLHAVDQYPSVGAFAFSAPVAVEVVVPGGPAAAAGLAADDGVVAIAGRPLAPPVAGTTLTSATRDAAQALIATRPPGDPLAITILRGGAPVTVTVIPRAGCRVAVEAMAGDTLGASSDGAVIQIGARLLERFDDAAIAVVVAHELAHAILRHRARLEAAGVRWGVLAEFGRNGRLFRTTETEADLLGAYLLRNAGYDPYSAVRFWGKEGAAIDGGAFRSRTHPSAKARAAAIAAELATMPADAPIPYLPPLLQQRDRPLE